MARRQPDSIDQVALPDDVPGALFLCGQRAVAPDHRRAIALAGGATVVCLVNHRRLTSGYPEYAAWLERASTDEAICWPIKDFHAPPLDRFSVLVDQLADRLRGGANLLVHCAGGMGRTGTVAVCVLIRLGLDAGEAQRRVDAARPGAGPEVRAQRRLVKEYAATVRTEQR